jgi:hypothetical protein
MVLTWEGSDGGSVPAGEDDAPGPVIVATDAPSDRSDNEPASSPSQRSLSKSCCLSDSLLILDRLDPRLYSCGGSRSSSLKP